MSISRADSSDYKKEREIAIQLFNLYRILPLHIYTETPLYKRKIVSSFIQPIETFYQIHGMLTIVPSTTICNPLWPLAFPSCHLCLCHV